MKVKDKLNIKYADLCQRIADLEFQKEKLEKHILSLKREVRAMDLIATTIGDLELKVENEKK